MTNKLAEQQDKARFSHINANVQGALAQMPDLINASEATRLTMNIWSAAVDAAKDSKNFQWTQDGLRGFITQAIKYVALGLDAVNRELYVYPYGNLMTITPSSHGILKLIKEHAIGVPIKDMLVFVVREGEEFNVTYGARSDEWEYKNKMFSDGKPLGYVTVLVYEDGTSRVMEHTLEDIARRRKASKAPNSPAWTQWETEMAKAKAIKRHAKTVNIKLKPEMKQVGVEKIDDIADFEDMKDVTPDVIELPEVAESKSEKVTAEVEVMPDEEVPLPFGYGDSGQGQIDEGWMR
ncbi:MAG: recombinase RecT [Aliarcobacter sp.]